MAPDQVAVHVEVTHRHAVQTPQTRRFANHPRAERLGARVVRRQRPNFLPPRAPPRPPRVRGILLVQTLELEANLHLLD